MSLKDKLKNLGKMASPEAMAMNMLEGFLPQLKDMAQKLNRPEQEGGLLKGDEKQAVLMIDFSKEKPAAFAALLKLVDGNTVISRAIDIQDLQKEE